MYRLEILYGGDQITQPVHGHPVVGVRPETSIPVDYLKLAQFLVAKKKAFGAPLQKPWQHKMIMTREKVKDCRQAVSYFT
jgi:hypothetical protein